MLLSATRLGESRRFSLIGVSPNRALNDKDSNDDNYQHDDAD
jgi:hypothetical protein